MFASFRTLIVVLIGMVAGSPAPTTAPSPAPGNRLHAAAMPVPPELPEGITLKRLAYRNVMTERLPLSAQHELRCIVIAPAPILR